MMRATFAPGSSSNAAQSERVDRLIGDLRLSLQHIDYLQKPATRSSAPHPKLVVTDLLRKRRTSAIDDILRIRGSHRVPVDVVAVLVVPREDSRIILYIEIAIRQDSDVHISPRAFPGKQETF